jgi:uncharacterized protein YutE (UPF0331/DUF86 family)
MSRPAAPPAPLEEHDPERARALKAKIRDRVSDVRRHLIALRTAMADFGENFDLEAFQAAYDSEDPVALNRVKAVERGVDQLYNYIAELAAFGLELAEIRTRDDDLNARRDLQALERIGVLRPQRAQRLERLRELLRLLVHEYATAAAEQVHEAARLVAAEFIPFYDAYRGWISRGFGAARTDRGRRYRWAGARANARADRRTFSVLTSRSNRFVSPPIGPASWALCSRP